MINKSLKRLIRINNKYNHIKYLYLSNKTVANAIILKNPLNYIIYMLNRNFLKASGAGLLALTGLAALVNDSHSFPLFNSSPAAVEFQLPDLKKDYEKIREESKYARESMIFSYEEWKELKETPNPPNNTEELENLIQLQMKLIPKISSIIKNPQKAYEFLTNKEKIYYESELNMLDAEEKIIAPNQLNQTYSLHFTPETFDNYPGAKLIWFLDRHYSYRYSDEKAKNEKDKSKK